MAFYARDASAAARLIAHPTAAAKPPSAGHSCGFTLALPRSSLEVSRLFSPISETPTCFARRAGFGQGHAGRDDHAAIRDSSHLARGNFATGKGFGDAARIANGGNYSARWPRFGCDYRRVDRGLAALARGTRFRI